ncbi:hypothetical protein ARMGADRAFT_1030267 [Armillaria gallica]|uniref:Uncharacterized protein n=1 Tax=Armillaria gallica TaxID=47427 RepID=A0A2H3DX69_ARMGA|nr:hypothetical protein ARMGADRAFT_1030267 [Armillaria gallica]
MKTLEHAIVILTQRLGTRFAKAFGGKDPAGDESRILTLGYDARQTSGESAGGKRVIQLDPATAIMLCSRVKRCTYQSGLYLLGDDPAVYIRRNVIVTRNMTVVESSTMINTRLTIGHDQVHYICGYWKRLSWNVSGVEAHRFLSRRASSFSVMLVSQLVGIYTGIFAVTMWNITISKSQRIGWPMVVAIILLYILTSIDGILSLCSTVGHISHGQNIWMRYLGATEGHNMLASVGPGAAGIICNILADSAMIWCCWMVWGQHYLIIVLPSLCLVSGTDGATDIRNPVLYAAFSLATTLWCTLLIIYRILSVGWENSEAGGGVRPYWHLIEILVESSTLYSGIAPTLLIGCVAAGHARPDDSWQGSIMSSLHFGQVQSQTGTQDSIFTINLDDDPEAHMERTDEPDSECIQTGSQRVRVSSDDIETQLEEVEIGCSATTVVLRQ